MERGCDVCVYGMRILLRTRHWMIKVIRLRKIAMEDERKSRPPFVNLGSLFFLDYQEAYSRPRRFRVSGFSARGRPSSSPVLTLPPPIRDRV